MSIDRARTLPLRKSRAIARGQSVISFDANLIKRIAELFALVNGSADARIAVQQFAHEYPETVDATRWMQWHRGIVENR